MKRYEKYKDSGIEWVGEIPEGWEVKKIKYLLEKNNGIKIGPFGSSLKLSTLTNSGIKIYGQGNLIKDDFSSGSRYLDFKRFEQDFLQYEIFEGDVLITMMGTTGKSKIFKHSYERGILDSHLLRLRLKQDVLLSELFVVLFQESDYINNQIRLNSKGSIMEGLNSSIIKELGVIVPPFKVQISMSNYLDRKMAEIDKLISQKERLIELYEEEKTAIINQAVTKGIDPDNRFKDSGVGWIGEVPEGWIIVSLKWVSKIYSGGTPDRNNPDYWFNGTIPWLNSGAVNQIIITEPSEHITEYGFQNSSTKWIDENSIVIALAGQGKTKGMAALVTFKTTGNQSLGVIKPNPNINSKFLLYFFIRSYLNIRGIAGEGIRDGLNLEMLGGLPIPLPGKSDQTAIVRHIETETARINAKIAKTRRIIELQKEYRTALISEVVIGKIKITEETIP